MDEEAGALNRAQDIGHCTCSSGYCMIHGRSVGKQKQDDASAMKNRLENIAMRSVKILFMKDYEYGSSWRRRGGQQAFAVIARKWDRLESILQKMENGYDIFEAWDRNPGNIQDDIRDLRDYLFLLEEYLTRASRD